MSQIHKPLALVLTGLSLLGCDASPEAREDARVDARVAAADAPSPSAAPSKTAGAERRAADVSASAEAPSAGESAKADAAAEDSRHLEPERQEPPPRAGQLTAGRWSDRDDWGRWQQLLSPGSSYRAMLDAWGVGRLERVAVTLEGRTHPAADTQLVLEDAQGRPLWQARTDNQGRADLYLAPGRSARLVARGSHGQTLAAREVSAAEQHRLHVDDDVEVAAALDLMFVVDTTGSMGDELSYLQNELSEIVTRVERESAQALRIRTSVNFYRDQGDDYVVRSFPFTGDLGQTLASLRTQYADGGGDYPEALDAALDDAVRGHEWSESAVARIVFVVTDAPPHEGARIGQRLQDTAALAASKGIRIVPIASSGVDKPTELMLRHLAVSTGGTYVFLTDHSGIGNAHIEPTVGPYVVEPLDQLIVDVIGEYTQADALQLYRAPTPAPAALQSDYHRHEPIDDLGWAWGWLGLGLVPAFMAGFWWHRSRRVLAPVSDARVARARRMLAELGRLAREPRHADAKSWTAQVREVVEGIEQLARQQQAIDASLRVAGHTDATDRSGMRATLLDEVARRRKSIDAEIDAGLVAVEAAYLHAIGGVGERTNTQASLDAALEALQTRIELEHELRCGR